MAARVGRKASFRDHAGALHALYEGSGLAARPRALVVYGTSEFLLNRSIETLRARAVAGGAVAASIEATTLTEPTLHALCSQTSLFEPETFYVIRRCEQARKLPKQLELAPAGAGLGNRLCFVYKGESLPAALRNELGRLDAKAIPCFDPWPSEMKEVITTLSASLGLKLKPDAVQLLIDTGGADLVKQHNELRKIALIVAGEEVRPLTAADLAPYLGMLREDDAFQLDRLLLARQWAKALTLTDNLLQRGEKELALLGILASHCRNVIRVAEARSLPPDRLAASVRLPAFILKTYTQHIGPRTDTRAYARALALCQETDVLLKSTPISGGLLLARIIDTLGTPG